MMVDQAPFVSIFLSSSLTVSMPSSSYLIVSSSTVSAMLPSGVLYGLLIVAGRGTGNAGHHTDLYLRRKPGNNGLIFQGIIAGFDASEGLIKCQNTSLRPVS